MSKWSIALLAAILGLAGCAAESPVRRPAGLEQKIEGARTHADHAEIAAVYEQEAAKDRAAAQRHRGLARAYEKGWVWEGPKVGGVVSAKRANQSVIAHCESLTRIYDRAAEENFALEKLHRDLAARNDSARP